MEVDEGKSSEGSILGAVCGWYNVWHGFVVAIQLVFVWNGILLVLRNECISATFSRAKQAPDSVETVVSFVFSINVCSFEPLFDLLQFGHSEFGYYNQSLDCTFVNSFGFF